MVEKDTPDVLQVQGRLTLGYGIIPKLAMQDQRLTIEAKAIYSYICSFAGAGTSAFPSRDKILHDLNISKDRYYKHFDILKKHGYITVQRESVSSGKFTRNIYILLENIESNPVEIMDNPVDKSVNKPEPCPENKDIPPRPGFTDAEKPDAGNKDTIINNNKINNIKINSKDIKLSKSMSDANSKNKDSDNLTDDDDIDIIDKKEIVIPKKFINPPPIYDYQETKNIIHANIEYAHYLKYRDNPRSLDIRLIDEAVECMLDVICTQGQRVRINSELKDRQIVIEKYLSLNASDIKHIIMKYEEQREKITHINSYLKTLLYTVKQENNFFYTNAVRVDGLISREE